MDFADRMRRALGEQIAIDLDRQLMNEGVVEKAAVDFLSKEIKASRFKGKVYVAGGYVRDELLGLDPMYVANEGRFIVIVPASDADRTAAILGTCFPGLGSTIVGEVTDREAGVVTMRSIIGIERMVDMHSGEQLPRIC